MIHYTLLPEEQIKKLKRDYRVRVLIVLMFFIASGIVVGILSLFPSYIVSYNQEKNLLNKVENIQKTRASDGIDNMISELNKSYYSVKALRNDKTKVSFKSNIEEILGLRSKGITITSFEIASSSEQEGISEMIIQGDSATRETLLSFKKNIESDANISNVVLPISDLTKSKNISFAIKFLIKKPNEK
jgi:hypothetical protein